MVRKKIALLAFISLIVLDCAGFASKNEAEVSWYRKLGSHVSYFGKDLVYFCTSPSRMNRKALVTLGGITLVSGALYYYDGEIYDMAVRNEEHKFVKNINEAGEFLEPAGLMLNTSPVFITGYAVGLIFDKPKLNSLCFEILETHQITTLLRRPINKLVGRTRPNDRKGDRFFKFNHGVSFISGHTSTAFQDATILAAYFDNIYMKTVFYSYATLVAWQRTASGAHWASDVFLGAVFGTAIAKGVMKLNAGRNLKISVKTENYTQILTLSYLL